MAPVLMPLKAAPVLTSGLTSHSTHCATEGSGGSHPTTAAAAPYAAAAAPSAAAAAAACQPCRSSDAAQPSSLHVSSSKSSSRSDGATACPHPNDDSGGIRLSSACLIDWETVREVVRPPACVACTSDALCSPADFRRLESSCEPHAPLEAQSPVGERLQHLTWQVVRTLHRDQLLVVERVAGEMTAESAFPDRKCATFEEYYASRRVRSGEG